MNLCSQDHDEVCYEGRNCPACAVAEEKDHIISKMQDKESAMENQIGDLESEIEDLKGQIE